MPDNTQEVCAQYNAALNFALDHAPGSEGLLFLSLWREGAWDEIANEFPEFDGPLPADGQMRELVAVGEITLDPMLDIVWEDIGEALKLPEGTTVYAYLDEDRG